MSEPPTQYERYAKDTTLRQHIQVAAGDTDSVLGTTSDSVQLLLHHYLQLLQALTTVNSLAELRQAAIDAFEPLQTFFELTQADDFHWPFELKGVETVLADIETRATAIAHCLENKS